VWALGPRRETGGDHVECCGRGRPRSGETVKRSHVMSSNIRSVGYDPENGVLEVKFHNNRVYQYLDVPAEEFEALMAAESKGRFLNQVIKKSHPYRAA
jgi:hypothetical protein